MQLYVDAQYSSPYALSVFVGLTEKQLAFECIPLDLAIAENHTAAYAQISLTQRVPTLVDGDFALAESTAITEYLDEAYSGQALYPWTTKQKAIARQVQAWLRSDFMPIREERCTEVIFYGKKFSPLSLLAQQSKELLINALNQLIKPKQLNLFDEWCIADTDIAVMLNRLILHGDTVPNHLIDYAQYQWQRPSVQTWLNQKRPALEPA